MARFITLISVLGAAVHVSAWGNLGHETVGYVPVVYLDTLRLTPDGLSASLRSRFVSLLALPSPSTV